MKREGTVELVARALENDGCEVAVRGQARAELLAIRDAGNHDDAQLAEHGEKEKHKQRQFDLQAAEALQAGHKHGVEAEDSATNRESLHGAEDRAELLAAGVVNADRIRCRHLCHVLARHAHRAHLNEPQRHLHLTILVVVRNLVRVQGQRRRADEGDDKEKENQRQQNKADEEHFRERKTRQRTTVVPYTKWRVCVCVRVRCS